MTTTLESSRVRVVLVEDITALREGLPALLPAFDFVAAYSTVEELLDQQPTAEVVLLDLHLANESQQHVRQGVAAVRAVTQAGYRVCIYSQEERRMVLAACLAAGAKGLVRKSAPLAATAEAIQQVAAGGIVISQSLINLSEVLVRREGLTVLGKRQRELLAGRARGETYSEIAKRLFLAEATLRGYWKDITIAISGYFQETNPADIERLLGLGPGDLLDIWPDDTG